MKHFRFHSSELYLPDIAQNRRQDGRVYLTTRHQPRRVVGVAAYIQGDGGGGDVTYDPPLVGLAVMQKLYLSLVGVSSRVIIQDMPLTPLSPAFQLAASKSVGGPGSEHPVPIMPMQLPEAVDVAGSFFVVPAAEASKAGRVAIELFFAEDP